MMSIKYSTFLVFTLLTLNLFASSDDVSDLSTGLRYVVSGKDVLLQNPQSGEELARFTDTTRVPEQILIQPALEIVYVREKNQVHVLNSRTLELRDDLKLDGHPGRMELSSSGSLLFIEFPEERAIATYEGATLELVSWAPFPENFQSWSAGDRDSLQFQETSGKSISADDLKRTLDLPSAPPPANVIASSEFTLSQSNGAKDFPSVDFDSNGNFAASWTDLAGNDGNGEGVYTREFDSNGNPQGGEFIANTNRTDNQGNSTLGSASNGDYVLVWRDDHGFDGDRFGVFFRRFTNGGGPKDPTDQKLANTTSGNQKEPSVDSEPDGDFVAAWDGPSGSDKGVFARQFNASGTPKGNEQVVDKSSEVFAPDVATSSSGRYVVVWRDGKDDLVRARVFNSNGNPVGASFKVDNSSNDQFAPTVAMDSNGDFVVAWQQNATGGIKYRRFDASGNPKEGTKTASQDNKKDYSPSMSMTPDGRFCIAWRDENEEAWTRTFQANGNPDDSEFKPSQSGGKQFAASCGEDSSANYVVAWKYRPGGGGGSIRGRKFGGGGGGGTMEVKELTKTTGKRGTEDMALSIKGSGFQDGAKVSFNDGKINILKVNWRSNSRLKIHIEIKSKADLGPHDVTVTNPDGTTATGNNLFNVTD
jgi:hypothetical protein